MAPTIKQLRYYRIRKGRGYWLSTPAMQAMGFPSSVPCGPDGPEAWRIAAEWTERWDRARTGREPPPKNVWPRGALGEGFERFRRSNTWAAKQPATRTEWERCWRRIGPIFGDVAPRTVSFDQIDSWYHALLDTTSDLEAWRAMKIWRAMWQVVAAMGYCEPDHDPSFGVRRKTPTGRSATWSEGETVQLIKAAWRSGRRGLAVAIALAYDTSMSPVDVRALTFAQSRADGRRVWFEVSRAKTGRSALGTLSRRATALLTAYLRELPVDLHPDAPIVRNRSGRPYSKDKLGRDFRAIRDKAFPGDTRKLMDMRRSGAVEALAGGADAGAISAKLANTLSDAKELQRVYLPVDRTVVELADEARRTGRRRLLANKSKAKVETLRPGELKPAATGDDK